MSLTSGTRLGSYEIVAPLGAGGMGEVYRGRDTKLNREVAIKVLPASFALDPDRAARFTREAQLLASLNHPNIAQIYGVEESGEGPAEGVRALVMELVAGEDLSAIISRHAGGPGRPPGGMPLVQVLSVARQIAEALDAAHEQGIVHRDLKPQNIKVREDGAVKVLDFGLAKAMQPVAPSAPALLDSPTMTVAHAHGETQVGMIMGTAPYMAPEQARGRPVDKRADIWAFGVVLFEMLSGRRAFVGDSVTDILARVIERDPDWSALPPTTPPHIRRLVERCLAKDPKARLRDIAEARVIIEDKAPLPVSGATAVFVPATAPSPAPARFARLWSLPIVAAAVAGAVLAMAALWLTRTPTSIVTPGVMVEASLGADGVIDTAGVADVGASLALSRDGQQLAFVALDAAGQTNLFVRGLQQLDAKRLPGTEGASSPFFAPDGQSIGFFAHGKLKKVTLAGIVTSLADAPHGRGGVFTDDGRILYSPNSPSGIVLMSVPTDGGTPTKLLPLMPGEATQRWPQILPGGKTVLYTSHRSVAGFDRAEIVAAPLDGGAPKVVLKGAYDACYLPSGHLLFMRQGTLFAIAFDLATLTPRGEPEPLAQHVSSSTIHGSASFAVSPAGVLAYVSGPVVSKTRPIYWMNRAGALTPLRETPLDWDSPRVSPDGRFIAMTIDEGERENVFVYDPARDLLTRIASADMNSQGAVWAPDGKHIAFAADVDGARNLFWARSDGSGGIERLTRSPRIQVPTSFDPTGKQLAYFEVNPETKMDAMLLPLEGSDAQGWRGGASVPIANTPANEGPAAISPDGRWVAYASEVSGRVELYVQKFPGVGPRIQISTDGAQYPVWSRTKSELFYEGPGSVIMVAPYRVNGESLIPEKPRAWSPVRFWNPGARWAYDLHPDGQRFVVSKVPTADGARGDQVVLSTELFAQLQRLVPTKR